MATIDARPPLAPSALSSLISRSDAKSAAEALPFEILHNLEHQHHWTDLKRHLVCLDAASLGSSLIDLDGDGPRVATHSPSSSGSSTPLTSSGETVTLISGIPPRHSYVHPDLQTYMLRHSVPDTAIAVQREFVLPLSLGEKWTLGRFSGLFDHLPERDVIRLQVGGSHSGRQGNGTANANGRPAWHEHHDHKRVLLGMKAREGGGGDGTVIYYIMQEGEVKPRQNG